MLELADPVLGLEAADLLVERVEELLAGGGARERGAVVERPAEPPEVEQSLGGAVEHHPHAVEHINDARRGLGHVAHRRLAGQEVAAEDGVVEMLPGGVALALEVLGGVDASLRADGVRALHRYDGEHVHRDALLGDFDGGHQARQSTPNDNDLGLCHESGVPNDLLRPGQG